MLLGTQKVRETKTWELYVFDKIIIWRNETVDSNLFNRISVGGFLKLGSCSICLKAWEKLKWTWKNRLGFRKRAFMLLGHSLLTVTKRANHSQRIFWRPFLAPHISLTESHVFYCRFLRIKFCWRFFSFFLYLEISTPLTFQGFYFSQRSFAQSKATAHDGIVYGGNNLVYISKQSYLKKSVAAKRKSRF